MSFRTLALCALLCLLPLAALADPPPPWGDVEYVGDRVTLLNGATLNEGAALGTPAANRTVMYALADGLVYSKDDAGLQTLMSSGPAANTLAQTLVFGALTGGTPLSVSTGDSILGVVELTLDAAAALTIGGTTATSLALGRVGVDTTVVGDLRTNDDNFIRLGTTNPQEALLSYDTTQTNPALRVVPSAPGNAIMVVSRTNLAVNYGRVASPDPEIVIYSNSSVTNRFISLKHTAVASELWSGIGGFILSDGGDGVGDATLDCGRIDTPDIELDTISSRSGSTAMTVAAAGAVAFSGDASLNDNAGLGFGDAGGDSFMFWSTFQTQNSLTWTPGDTSNSILVLDFSHRIVDMGHANQPNPTIFWHANSATTTLWGSAAHDGTNFVLATGSGDLVLDPAGGVLYNRVVEDHTADNLLTIAESGKVNTNLGDAGLQIQTLPATPNTGDTYTFAVVVAFEMRIDPQAGDHLIYSGGAMGDGEYLSSSTVGSSLTVTALSGDNWLVTREMGTWTEETP